MTECHTTSVDFTPLGRRQVVADFLGGRLTTDAGALLLREVDRRIGLLDSIDQTIPDPRDPRYTVHDQRAMLAQRILSLALGYEDLNDQQTLRLRPSATNRVEWFGRGRPTVGLALHTLPTRESHHSTATPIGMA